MRLAYLIPDGSYEFFRELVPPLRAAGIDVAVNAIPPDTDLILAGILPITHPWIGPLKASGKPFVLWHWDLYPFTDYRQPHWGAFLALLPQAADVWSCGYETARQLKEKFAIDSHIVPPWVNSANLARAAVEDCVFYASSGGGVGKRVEWAERACQLLGLPLRLSRNQQLSRREYLHAVGSCRAYLSAASHVSSGTIPAMEAAACGRPVVLADLPASREVFGDDAHYYPAWDFGAMLDRLREAWDGGRDASARVLAGYDLPAVAAKVVKRLGAIL
jgi:hypothetical protein